jgi:hypothetical protein
MSSRLTDAVDLLIDFATLGEYGLEPVGRTSPSCETRHRRPAPAPVGPSRRRRAGDPGRPSGTLTRLRPSEATPSSPPRRRHPVTGPFLLRP